MKVAGAVNPQSGEASLNQLAKMAGTYASTLSRMVRGDYRREGASPEVIAKVAVALDKAPSEVAGWLNIEWAAEGPWTPPPGADLMDTRQRQAVEEIIRVFIRDARR